MLCPTSEITGTIIKVDFLIQSLLKTNCVSLLPFLELPQNDIIFALNCNDLKKKHYFCYGAFISYHRRR